MFSMNFRTPWRPTYTPFRGPGIRTNIGPERIGMNGLYQSVKITIFECLQHSLHYCYRIVSTHYASVVVVVLAQLALNVIII
jgi:hypothetical protein